MKFLITVVLVFFCGSSVNSANYTLDQVILDFITKIQIKCTKIGGESAFLDLQIALLDLNSCTYEYRKTPETICTKHRKNYFKCYLNFAHKLDLCLEVQEKYFKSFYLNAYNTFVNAACKNGDTSYFSANAELLFYCKDSLDSILSDYVNKCLPKLRIVQNLHNYNDVITAPELCRDVASLKNCIKIEKHCSEYYDLQRYLDLTFDSCLDSCSRELLHIGKKNIKDIQRDEFKIKFID